MKYQKGNTKKKIHFKIIPQQIKYLGINLTKEVKDLYIENYKTLIKETKDDSTNLENSAGAAGQDKVSFHSNPKKGNAKGCSNYRTTALISHASKVMLKILQARLQQYELQP